jgi:hypothetical protein
MDAAAMALAVQQLQQGMHTMQLHRADDARRHTEEIRRLRAEGAAAAAAAAARALPMGATMRLPPAALYDGHTPPLEEWLSAMSQQYAWYGWISDADRIRAGAAHLAGAALEWWQHPPAGVHPATWDLFEAGLRARFQPVTSAETARAKLFTLAQGRTSITVYVAAFRRLLAAIPGMDTETQKHVFVKGLNEQIREAIRASGVATLDAAITMAVRIGTPMEPAAAAAAPAVAEPSDPMDLSAIRAEYDPSAGDALNMRSQLGDILAAVQRMGSNSALGPARPLIERDAGFTPQRLEEYMNAHRCFGCHETGHGLRVCPKRKVDASGRVTWSTQ